MIYAALILIGGISISLKEPIEKRFKNNTLAFLSLIYTGATIVIGFVASVFTDNIIIPIILIMMASRKVCTSIWYILETKYLKNFTTAEARTKVTFIYEFLQGISRCIFSITGGILLKLFPVKNAYLMVGLFFFGITIATLDYMKTRFGLKPREYSKQDIDFSEIT